MIYTSNIPEGLIPDDDKERLQQLKKYKILDTEPEEVYDNIVKEARELFNTPRACINFVDRDRIFFKSSVGSPTCKELPRYASFCSIAIHNKPVTLFTDTRNFPQLLANPFVNGSNGTHMLRFYVGAPLSTPEGFQIGTLCATDDVPREVTEAQLIRLQELAKKVMDELNIRLQLQQSVKGQLPN